MNDYDYGTYEDEPPPRRDDSGPDLPGGVSLQVAAAVLLVAVLLATLYLFFGPMPGGDSTVSQAPEATASTQPTGVSADTTVIDTPTPPAVDEGATQAGPVGAAPTSAVAQPTVAASTTNAGPPVLTPAAPGGAGLSEGGFALVAGTGTFGLRLRLGPGLDFVTIRFADEGETLKVTGGPERTDDITWWRLQDNLGNVGWGAGDYIVSTTGPQSWNPPLASPTFPPDNLGTEGESGASGSP